MTILLTPGRGQALVCGATPNPLPGRRLLFWKVHLEIMNKKLLLLASALAAGFAPHALAQYSGWQHEGSLCILTTPEGADLPASASEENFPLLVRLSKETFDFSQTKAQGEDIQIVHTEGMFLLTRRSTS